jgi:nucleoside-diphosphate-sugar epimerase
LNLLIGGTGFVGGHVVEYLFQQGEISKGTFRKGSYLKIMDSNGVQGIEADLLDHHSLHEAMEGVDVVYNMASPMPDTDTGFHRTNTEGILNLLEVATEAKVKALVHLSTLDIHGFGAKSIDPFTAINPSDEYQKSKAEGERLLVEFSKRSSSPRIAVIRSAKAIGSRDESLVVPILRMIQRNRVILPTGGKMSFTHPRDIAQAMFKAGTGQVSSGSVYLIKSFDATPAELVAAIMTSLGKDVKVRKQGFLSGSNFSRYTSEQLRASARIDFQQSWAELDYAPSYDLKKTSEELATWYRKEPWVTEGA